MYTMQGRRKDLQGFEKNPIKLRVYPVKKEKEDSFRFHELQ
jgi:hypothetical protein